MSNLGPFLFYILVAAALISAELLIFNLSVFWFLFIGIGAACAALLAWLVPDIGWVYSSLCFVTVSVITAGVLYAPLRRWQQAPSKMPGNDAVGQSVELVDAISCEQGGKVLWSGATWEAKLVDGSEPLAAGTTAEIVSINGIVLTIKSPN